MKNVFFILLFWSSSHIGYATHNRGARIEARPYSPAGFIITITTFTRTSLVNADRPSLDSVHTGDGFIVQFIRNSFVDLPGDLRVNTYMNSHTYPGQGRYLVYFTDPNRDADILNIPHSVSVPLSVEMEIVIDFNSNCPLNSPQFLANPFFQSSIGRELAMNVAAYDPNRDSLSYVLVPCHGINNDPVPGYSLPGGVDINPYSGEFHWNKDSMHQIGDYSFAVRIDKWHNGLNVGHCLEDFSLELDSGDASADFINTSYPVNPLGFFSSSISPGNIFNLHVEYIDTSSVATLSLFSEVTNVCTLSTSHWGDTINADLSWVPSTYYSRKQPYSLIFRSEPPSKDLTYLVYVNGLPVDTCYSWIGVNELINEKGSLSVFPNPASSFIEIEFNSDFYLVENNIPFFIYDLNRRCIMKDNLERANTGKWKKEIGTEGFSDGIYMVRAGSEAEAVFCKFVLFKE